MIIRLARPKTKMLTAELLHIATAALVKPVLNDVAAGVDAQPAFDLVFNLAFGLGLLCFFFFLLFC